MKLADIQALLEATVHTQGELPQGLVATGCGSDLMSDVLAFAKEKSVILTGLVNAQVVRTAEMMDTMCIVFVRGKTPDEAMVALAQERGIVLMSTKHPMFVACGKLYQQGLRGGGEMA